MSTATTNTAGETIIGNDDNLVIDGAVTEVKAPDNALVILNPVQFATELFQPFHDQLAALRRQAGRAKYDIRTKDGMAKAKELRTLAVRIRTTADKAKVEAKRPIDQSGKLLLEHFNKLAELAKAEEAKHNAAIEAEEARIAAEKQRKLDEERERVEALQAKVDSIRMFPSTLDGATSEQLRAAVEEWAAKSLTKAEYEDHFEDGVIALEGTVRQLRGMLASALEREEAARKAEADRLELDRLRAEQARRDAEEVERQAAAAAAAAEQQRQLEAQQAAMAKQQQIMQDLQDLQAKGMVDGDARQLDDALQALHQVDATEATFGNMASMANMAKSSGIALLTQKLLARVIEAHGEAIAENELRDAHAAALADNAMFDAHTAALDMEAERLHLEGQGVRLELATGARYSMTTLKDNGEGIMLNKDGTRSVFCDLADDMEPEAPAAAAPIEAPRPSNAAILELVANYYGVFPATALGWMRELAQDTSL